MDGSDDELVHRENRAGGAARRRRFAASSAKKRMPMAYLRTALELATENF
jgi:hypothetical protein